MSYYKPYERSFVIANSNKKFLPLFIDAEFVSSSSSQTKEVLDPSTQDVLTYVPYSSFQEMDRAVESAQQAFKNWRDVPVPERARFFFKYQQALKDQQEEIAQILSQENGKTFEDAKGDVWRGIEVVEQACHAPALMMGESVENVSRGIDIHSILQPLGVCLGITPFNFPAMIPLWMFPLSIVCGNTFILKPSEKTPQTANKLAEIFQSCGFPKGLLNVIHGGVDQANYLIEHKDIKAISFVGSFEGAKAVYRRGTSALKRVQAFSGAKNHMLIMKDAPKKEVIKSLVSSSCGAAGQRCMAISVGVFVDCKQDWIDEIAKSMSSLKPCSWKNKEADFGPLISKSSRQRVLSLIEKAKQEGAKLCLDGSHFKSKLYPKGNFVGPTLFDEVKADMSVYKEEIFGPVLLCVRVKTLEEAVSFINQNPYGNGTSIFTRSGESARYFQHHIEVGQVGINLPIPVPLPFFSFTGWKKSFFGDLHAYGKQAIRFYTETKTIISRWKSAETKVNMTIKMK